MSTIDVGFRMNLLRAISRSDGRSDFRAELRHEMAKGYADRRCDEDAERDEDAEYGEGLEWFGRAEKEALYLGQIAATGKGMGARLAITDAGLAALGTKAPQAHASTGG